jgi:hypothetical protein
MEYFKTLFKNYIGPMLVAAVVINGYWAYSTIQVQQAVIAQLQTQTQELSMAIGNQCQTLLERQGFIVEEAKKKEVPEEN